jgi:lysozyme family protein
MTDDLRQEYIKLFDKCEVLPDCVPEVRSFANRLVAGKARYEAVSNTTLVPWFVIGMLHGMECGFSFDEHLHNGDSLKHRTVNEPKGRPTTGDPPFAWLFSAIDALQYDSFTSWADWSIAGICYKVEAYNGWGYRKHHINSPYLWSFSNLYQRGKYVSDGHWDADAVSKQVGAITALKWMVNNHVVELKAVEVKSGE